MALALVSNSKAGNNVNTGGAVTVTAPTSISTGNLLVAQISSGTNTFTLPSGWTSYETIPASGDAPQIIIAYKYATSSEPSTYVFTPSTTADVALVGIFNFNGANPTTPFNGLFFTNTSTAAQTAGATSGTPSVPTVVGCLPLAIFGLAQLNPSNAGNPTGLTSGWAAEYLNVLEDTTNYGNIANYNGYAATFTALGPANTDTTTAITASCTWGGASSEFVCVSAMLFINPNVAGAITFTPSSITITAPGATTTVTVAQSGSTSTISLSSSNTGIFTVSPSTVTGPSGTVTVTGVATGTATLNATSPV